MLNFAAVTWLSKTFRTSAGLCEAVIMTPMVAPFSFFERKAAKMPTLYITESNTSALQVVSVSGHSNALLDRKTYFARKPAVP